jgi:predicted alpha-1,2-mannosidase
MKNIFCILVALLLLSQAAIAQKGTSNVQYVDPTIGSVGLLLVPTRPTAHLPNSMVRVFPSRKDQIDDQIDFFPLTISSHRQPSLFSLMPVSGPYSNSSWKKSFTWYNETTTPYYYAVRLEESGDSIEFTPSERSGFFRFHFSNNAPHFLRFGILNNGGNINVDGKRIITGNDSVKALPAFFYAEINTDIVDTRFADASQKQLLAGIGNSKTTVELRYGISFINIEQAKQNLYNEIGTQTFSTLKQKAFGVWNKTLSQINVEGGSEAQKRVFFTSLYRSYERMININEYGKYYSAYHRKVHESDKPFYVDNWLWDTYIALEPLHTILNPQMEVDKINSYISMFEQSGWMPSFALAFGDDPCMTGNHAAAWIADVWMKGNQNFDLQKGYEGLKKNSLTATLLPWRNGPSTTLDRFYNQNGYMPALYPNEKETVQEVHGFEKRQAVSVTLENSFDDWCIAQLANVLDKKEDRDLFLKRAANYKNVFRTDKGFVWPKDEKGNWIEPFDPKFSGGQGGRNYTTENNAYTWNWSVKHDLNGLFELMGGKEKAEAKLDNLFQEGLDRSKYDYWYTFPDATGLVGQFVMGNEPSFHIPYLYNYTGSPWKTQKRIRMLLDTWYTDNLFGIPGDEDGGGMTAFVVFSMMGFFPVTPGVPVYNIGSPVFENVSITLPNGKTFSVVAKNSSGVNRYIQSAMLNGKTWNKPWFTHTDIMNGGKLELLMGATPNKNWGAYDQSAPPSKIDLDPLLFNKSF